MPGVGRRQPTLNVVGTIALISLSLFCRRCLMSLLAYWEKRQWKSAR